MKLIDIKRKPQKEVKENTFSGTGPSFNPYPIKILLEKEELNSLGLVPKDFKTEMTGELTATFEVVMVKDLQTKNPYPWESSQQVELCIKKLGLGKMTENKPSKHDQYNEAKKRGPEGN